MIERHATDDLGAYALEALEPDERATVDRHLGTCATCRAEVEGYRQALWQVAEAGPFLTEPHDLRESVVARHRPPSLAARIGATWSVVGDALRRPTPALVPIALSVLLVLSLASLLTTRRDTDVYAQALAGVAGGRVVALEPQEPSARGALVIPERGDPYLVLQLPAPPSGRTWEAWVIRGERPLAAGISDPRGGVFTIVLTQPLQPGDQVAVTLELAGGVNAPTTRPVVAGRV